MNPVLQVFLLSQSILLAAITGAVKWKGMEPTYRPFVILCFAIALNEVVRYVLILQGCTNLVSYNLFLLLISWLYLWMYRQWGVFSNHPRHYSIILAAMVAGWVLEHLVLQGNQLPVRTPYYRLGFAMLQVMLAVVLINQLIVTERRSLLTNPKFMAGVAIIIYFTYRILVDAFSLQGYSKPFLASISNLNRYLVQAMNILFFIAALWIPRKKKFILPS
ncbi:MAG TPA: hypothetical protein PKD90_18840 [Phnomibacter sp.]|nr:hypothetical protein [Phnomibacter sp.]